MNRTKAFIVSQKKDKILVWIGADLTHFLFASGLQKKHDADYYAIIDITNKPKEFFLSQKFVDFKKVWYYHDEIKIKNDSKPNLEYLKDVEKKYDIDIWKLAINERIFYRFFNFHEFSSDEILSIEEKSIRLFENILEDIKPDFFLTKWPSFHHLELCKEMCKKSGCKIVMMSPPKLGYRVLLSEDVNVLDHTDDLDSTNDNNQNFEQMREYLQSHSSHTQLKKDYDSDSKKTISSELKVLMDYLVSSNDNIKTNYNYFGRTKWKVLTNLLSLRIKKKQRETFMDKRLLKDIDLSKQFIYFAMSTDLERYVLIDSPFYTNQIEVIRHVAKSIPPDHLLYLKENPSNVTRDWRPISEYNELLKIPNVRLIHPTFSNTELLKNCSLVVSIAGSSGFEAAFFEKSSIVFGKVLYSKLPSVYKVENLDEFPKTIKLALNTKVNEKDLNRYLKILENTTFECDLTGLYRKISRKFYFNESTVDVEIEDTSVKDFINENHDEIDKIVDEHIKKILQHKNN